MAEYPYIDSKGGPNVRILATLVRYAWDDGTAEHVATMSVDAFHARYDDPNEQVPF